MFALLLAGRINVHMIVAAAALSGLLSVAVPVYADYDSCKKSCARGYEVCTMQKRDKTPEQCAGIANSCLYDCKAQFQSATSSTQKRPSSVANDLESCKGEIESAITVAQRAGKSDSQVMNAGRDARDRCMSRKGR